MDMIEGRLSIFDTTGTYLRQERTNTGGWTVKPYPGGFDAMGRYNVLIRSDGTRVLARFDQSHNPIDTIPIPENPVEREFFETPRSSVSVPFQGSMHWRFPPTGTVWTLLTARYELTEMTTGGEVLRTVTKDREPIPVTDEDRQEAVRDLDWFTRQGGQIDMSKFPETKPATTSFFVDDEGNLRVERRVAAAAQQDEGRLFDIFEVEGRYSRNATAPLRAGIVDSRTDRARRRPLRRYQ